MIRNGFSYSFEKSVKFFNVGWQGIPQMSGFVLTKSLSKTLMTSLTGLTAWCSPSFVVSLTDKRTEKWNESLLYVCSYLMQW